MANQYAVTKADLVVGIDFGMTCTGVAYANLSRGEIVRTVQKWPGRGMANENKVPTIVVYSRQNQQVSSWGFASENRMEQNNLDKLYVDWFKVYLDETLLKSLQARDPEHTPNSIEEVEKWFIDYLAQLYKHIEFKLSQELQGKTWSQALVEFIFSVPTTWAPHPTVERFRSILRRAGYNQHPTHSIEVGLTEAEAAAVSTSVEAPGIFKENENLLICDVGGGTTDLSVMNVQSLNFGPPELKQMDVVIGRNIGSVKIDEAFEEFVVSRLRAADQATPMGIDVEDAAWNMMKSREYQNAKCDHGSLDDTPFFYVPVTNLSPAYTNESFGIQQGSMQFSQNDIRTLFEVQVTRLYELIDRQLTRFQQQHPTQTISHLILSGGLGNNAYIQTRLKDRYERGRSSFSAARNVQIHVAPDPQLAVAKGIVHNRVRKLNSGKSVLGWRCARASYGTLCKILFDENNLQHQTAHSSVDPLDGKKYVNQAIEWFIKKGEPVNSDTPIARAFKRKMRPNDIANRRFPTSILVSHSEAYSLPFTQHHGDSEILCDVISDLTRIPEDKFKLKNRHWWNTGKPYRRVNYDIKVVINPADISFELWFEGNKISRDHPIQIEWQSTTAPPPTIVDGTDGTLNVPAISKSRNVGKLARHSVAMVSKLNVRQDGVRQEHNQFAQPTLMATFRRS